MYKIELLSIPRFLFCCSVRVDNYKNEFRNRESFIEISLVEEGKITSDENEKKHIIEPHTLNIITSDRSCALTAYQNETQCHSTVGVSVDYKITKCDLSEATKDNRENILYLPQMKQLSDTEYESILMKIKKIAVLYNSFGRASKLAAVTAWYDLCMELTDMTLADAGDDEQSPSARLYVQQICKYVSEHLSEHISVKEMAESLGISEGYMQNTFKRVTKKSIVEYINEYKIKTAADMLGGYNMKLKDIAPCIGIDDPSYMSRLFKKVMGISFEEYRKNLSSIQRN